LHPDCRPIQFFFAGFLPARATARRARLAELRTIPATLIFYEAPHRIAATLKDALNTLGNRTAARRARTDKTS